MRVCLSADCLCVCAHVPTLCGKLSELARQRLRQRTFRSRSPCGTARSENTACVWGTGLTNWWRFNLHSGVQCCAHPAAALQFTSLLDPNTFRHHVVVTLAAANQSIMTPGPWWCSVENLKARNVLFTHGCIKRTGGQPRIMMPNWFYTVAIRGTAPKKSIFPIDFKSKNKAFKTSDRTIVTWFKANLFIVDCFWLFVI